jgi:hypothetical protein
MSKGPKKSEKITKIDSNSGSSNSSSSSSDEEENENAKSLAFKR